MHECRDYVEVLAQFLQNEHIYVTRIRPRQRILLKDSDLVISVFAVLPGLPCDLKRSCHLSPLRSGLVHIIHFGFYFSRVRWYSFFYVSFLLPTYVCENHLCCGMQQKTSHFYAFTVFSYMRTL